MQLRAFAHAMTGMVLGTVWFSVLVTMWATGLGTLITLIGLPIIWLTLAAAAAMARFEADLANALLGTGVTGPSTPGRSLRPGRALFDAQLYLLLRFGLGLACGCVLLSLAFAGPSLLATGITDQREWAIALAIPATVIGPVLAYHLSVPYARLWRGLAERLLYRDGPAAAPLRIPVANIAAVSAGATAVCVVIWLATGAGYFWPVWVAFGLATMVGLAAVRSKHALKGLIMAVCVAVWLLTGAGYFWPIWPLLGMLVHEGGERLLMDAWRSRRRVTELTETRAQVVDEQEDELRRIERDLHDGAQARLLALSMSLGLAESRLDEDPERARELMTEARMHARTAQTELRGLVYRIAPPVLRDRGLKAAIASLTATFPLPVTITGDDTRAPAAIERAAYFVATEALANAIKHAGAHELRVTVRTTPMDLTVEISDDGRGGADPDGSGLQGLKRRIEAVDGRLEVESTAAGTTVRASLPLSASS